VGIGKLSINSLGDSGGILRIREGFDSDCVVLLIWEAEGDLDGSGVGRMQQDKSNETGRVSRLRSTR
jgi:hypothetical protein